VAALARTQFGWERAVESLLGVPPRQMQREIEMLGTARRQPLTAFSYCFCDFSQSP
jgi:hypothetical protein